METRAASREAANLRRRGPAAADGSEASPIDPLIPVDADSGESYSKLQQEADDLPPGSKSTILAYICWFFGGVWGLHHVYLDRPRHAIFYATSFGGWGFAQLRDMWMIPKYVLRANRDLGDRLYLTEENYWVQQRRTAANQPTKPPLLFSWGNVCIWSMAWLYRAYFLWTIPAHDDDRSESYDTIGLVVATVSTGLTVYFLGTLPYRFQGSWMMAIIGALVGELYTRHSTECDDTHTFTCVQAMLPRGERCTGRQIGGGSAYCSSDWFYNPTLKWFFPVLFSWVAFQYSRSYAPKPPKPAPRGACSVIKTAVVVGVCLSLFSGGLMHGMYHNMDIEDNESGETTRLKDSINDIYNSPAWLQLREIGKVLWNTFHEEGYDEFKQKLFMYLNIDGEFGEEHAHKVLGTEEGATQKEIKKAVRTLQKKYHPDICKLEADVCTEKFQEVTKAQQLLDDRAASRASANEKSRGKKRRKKRKTA